MTSFVRWWIEVPTEDAVAFSYDLKAGEFRILDQPQNGKPSSALLDQRVNNTFSLRRTRPDGKVVTRELSLAGTTWALRTRSPESDITLRGSSRAIADFLKLEQEWAELQKSKVDGKQRP